MTTVAEAIRLIEECGHEMRKPSMLDIRERNIQRVIRECNASRAAAEWVVDHGAASDASIDADRKAGLCD